MVSVLAAASEIIFDSSQIRDCAGDTRARSDSDIVMRSPAAKDPDLTSWLRGFNPRRARFQGNCVCLFLLIVAFVSLCVCLCLPLFPSVFDCILRWFYWLLPVCFPVFLFVVAAVSWCGCLCVSLCLLVIATLFACWCLCSLCSRRVCFRASRRRAKSPLNMRRVERLHTSNICKPVVTTTCLCCQMGI